MFSGIVEEVGTVVRFDRQQGRLTIAADKVLSGESPLRISDSVAVSGACLTVVELNADGFDVDVAPETVRRTWFGRLDAGSNVNLERALKYGDRVGGHLVQGHVDGVGTIARRVEDGDNTLVTVRCPGALMRYIVEKGFIAVDGTSLTCFDCTADTFTFTLIPYTAAHTTLGAASVGDAVNIETDLTGKYVERFVAR